MSSYRIITADDGKEYAADASSYRLITAKLYPNVPFFGSLDPIDISGLAFKIKIKTDLNSPFARVDLVFVDTTSILESIKLNGGERIHLVLDRMVNPKENVTSKFKTENHKWDLDLYVSDISTYARKESNNQSFKLSLVTKEVLMNTLKYLERSFQGTIADVIGGIIKGDLKTPEDKYYVQPDTQGVVKGIFTGLRPIQAIQWLLHNTFDTSTPFYFHFSPLEGLRVISFKTLIDEAKDGTNVINRTPKAIKKGVYDTFEYSPFFKNTSGTLGSFKEQARKIKHISSPLNIGKMANIASGAYGSNMTSVDIASKKLTKSVFSYDPASMLTLNKNAPYNEIEHLDTPLAGIYQAKSKNHSENTKAFGTAATNVHGPATTSRLKQTAYSTSLDYMEHELTINGDFSIEPGMIINIEIIRAGDEETQGHLDSQVRKDAFISGNYMITSVISDFDSENFMQTLTIRTDSSEMALV